MTATGDLTARTAKLTVPSAGMHKKYMANIEPVHSANISKHRSALTDWNVSQQ